MKPVRRAPRHTDPVAHEPKTADIAIAYPVAVEELNRSSVHILDRVHIAVARLKSQHPSSENLSKMKTVIKGLQDILADIDTIAPDNRKAV